MRPRTPKAPLAASLLLTLTATTARPDQATSAPLFPHPVITEVLFNVPKGDDYDANLDSQRHSAADEFIELFNPHPKTINLRTYTITNRLTTFDDTTKRGIRFTFPECKLEPGELVVVFNGHDTRIPGPVGTARRPPAKPNEHFHDAIVFTMNATSRFNALANTGDFILLSDPRSNPIDAITWGEPDPEPPTATRRIAEVDKNPKGSVQRTAADTEPTPHKHIDRATFSPGRIPPDPDAATAEAEDESDH